VAIGTLQYYWVTKEAGSTYNWNVSRGTINSGNGTETISVVWQSNPGTGNVWVIQESLDGCKADTIKAIVNILTVTDIDRLTENNGDIFMYPNPAQNNLYVQFTGSDPSIDRINITNLLGTSVMQIDTYGKRILEINTSDLPVGIYAVSFIGKEGLIKTMKVLIER
jgi:hypothetical protein